MWLLRFLLKKLSVAALNVLIYIPISLRTNYKKWKLTSYKKVENFSLATYDTDGVIAETDSDITCNTQQVSNKTSTAYVVFLWSKTFHSGLVYYECIRKYF